MHRLSLSAHHGSRRTEMNSLHNTVTLNPPDRSVRWTTGSETGSESLEVNVIFTDPDATAAALKAAGTLARGLGAQIRLRAAITVPLRLAMEQAPVSIRFMEQLLGQLAEEAESGGTDVTVN